MDIARALELISEKPTGVLATIKPDGAPHQSVVSAAVIGTELWVSVTETRVKTRNVRNDPHVCFLSGLGPWAAVEGRARFLTGPDRLENLRTYYRTLRGEHPDWEDYDRVMLADGRMILAITPERAYGFEG